MSRARPVPADYAEVALCRPFAELCKHYGAGTDTVVRWNASMPLEWKAQRSLNIVKGRPPIEPPAATGEKVRSIPADFRDVAARMAMKDLRATFRKSAAVIRRWLDEQPAEWRAERTRFLEARVVEQLRALHRAKTPAVRPRAARPAPLASASKAAPAARPVATPNPNRVRIPTSNDVAALASERFRAWQASLGLRV